MQLTFKDLVKLFDVLRKNYTIEEILDMPIYIGDERELSGIYKAVRVEPVTDKEMFDEIKDKKFNGTAILIS